jgi:hypothetical protein
MVRDRGVGCLPFSVVLLVIAVLFKDAQGALYVSFNGC